MCVYVFVCFFLPQAFESAREERARVRELRLPSAAQSEREARVRVKVAEGELEEAE